jgi:outer membrane lipoprotein-sorting protein
MKVVNYMKMNAALFMAGACLGMLFSVNAQTRSLDNVISHVSAAYDRISSFSADADIYKYVCT